MVKVKRNDVIYPCKNEEQVKLFVEAGYEIIAEPKAEAPKAKTPKTKSSK